MAYGSDIGVMNMAYGGIKSVTPDIVPQARQMATSVVNGYLNINEDLIPIPQLVNDAANWIASEFVKNPRTPAKDLLEMADILLATVKDQLSGAKKWGNMRFV